MRNLLTKFGIALIAAVAISGCSNDDNGTNPGPQNTNSTTWDETGQFWVTQLNASSSTQYAYYSFANRDIVTLTDDQAKSSSNWDIAFKRSYIKTNGGTSGIGGVKAVDLTTSGIVATDAFAEVGMTELAAVQAGQWKSDSYDFALDSLWNYNPVTHQLSAKRYVYILSDAEGKYVKFQLLDVLDGLQPPQQGKMVIKFFYQSLATSTDLTGAGEVDTIDAADGFYYDFSTHSSVSPANPENSSEWDILVKAYDVSLNGSVFGTGYGAAFPVYDGLSDRTDFDAVDSLSQFGPPRWVTDETQSAFTATDWYDYDDNSHLLTSKGNTYLVAVDDKTYKVTIISYYDPDTSTSGTYTIQWAEI